MSTLKRHVVLIVVILVTLIASGVLLFLIWGKYKDMNKNLAKVEELKKEIEKLTKEKPAPVKENEERINEDIENLKARLNEIRKIFGKPYRIPLQDMASELGITEDELLSEWKKYWKEERQKKINKYTILSNFFKNFDQEKLKNALRVFRNDLLQQTAEPILDLSFKDILMAALNVPRDTSPVNCKTFIANMQAAFLKELKEAGIVVSKGVTYFTFDNYLGTSMPRKEDVPDIIRHWLMLDHLISLIKRSKLSKFDSISKEYLNPPIENGFLKLRYTIGIVGAFSAVRDFVNSMQEAYKENRVYIIKDIKLIKTTDAVDSLYNETETMKKQSSRFPDRFQPGTIPPDLIGADKKMQPKDKDMPPEFRENYGRPIIGISNNVKATITFEYIIYIGDELQE